LSEALLNDDTVSVLPVGYAFEQLESSVPSRREEPARIVERAAAEAERIREQARAEGYAEGRRTGHEQGSAEISSAAHALEQALRDIDRLRTEVADAVETDAIELALVLAEKILATTLEVRPELILEVIRGAVRRLDDRRRVTVAVNPENLETVRLLIGELPAQGSGIEHCEVVSDERIGVGGAIVRSMEGEVDASVQTQLERAREVIGASLEAERAGETSPEAVQQAGEAGCETVQGAGEASLEAEGAGEASSETPLRADAAGTADAPRPA
jgi:flagellar assembly protein FliH